MARPFNRDCAGAFLSLVATTLAGEGPNGIRRLLSHCMRSSIMTVTIAEMPGRSSTSPKRDARLVSWHVVAGPPEGISANAFHCAIVGADEL